MGKKHSGVRVTRPKRAYRYRSAVTGRYVTPEYAAKHPRETVKEKPSCSP